jgi:hypothetical protein
VIESFASALHDTPLAQALRASIWLYPLVNTAHVVGIALLFGAIAPLDLRLIGLWKHVPLEPLAATLVPVAITGLSIAVISGALLFVTRPVDYVVEPLFALKMALVAAAVLNALALRRSPRWRLTGVQPGTAVDPAWRSAAVASLVLWLGVITAGRLIGYR